MPVMPLNIVAASPCVVAAPSEAKLRDPGFERPSAMNSASVLAGTLGCTTRTIGVKPIIATGSKSLSGSYGWLFMSDGVMGDTRGARPRVYAALADAAPA